MGLKTFVLTALIFSVAAAHAFAQSNNPFAPVPVATTTPTINLASQFGNQLSNTGGPWVLGETLFFSGGKIVSDYAWRDKLKGQRGQLYTSSDLQSDVTALRELNVFDRISPSIHEIPNTPVPLQFATLSVSTSQVRIVFDVDIKASTAPVKPRLITPPSAVSGLILTPTAFRGAGKHNTPGLGLDINAAYFIGRLYGKNSYTDAPRRTNYLDRVGLWTLTTDGKMQLQSDGPWRPAMAVGGQAVFVFRDSPQPTVNTPGVSVKVNAKSTHIMTDAYFVLSKNIRKVRASIGVMQGNIGDLPANLSEFLTPEALRFYDHQPAGTSITSRTVPFGSILYLHKPDYPIGVEFMKFNGAADNPILINFKIGRLLKLNFDIAVLKFRGGYDVLGLFQFRYNHFPKN